MLAASSGIDMRGVLRTLRPVGRDTSRDSGTRIRFLLGSAASSSTAGAALAVAWMAWASVWLIAFIVKTPCDDGMQQRMTRQWRSVERRVGTECVSKVRSRGWTWHEKKKKN